MNEAARAMEQVEAASPLEDPKYWLGTIARGSARFFLLAALSGRPMHGYQLARAIAQSCGGCCEPSDAMIYPTIRELEEGGYISCWVESQGARRRRVCRLTERGMRAYRTAAAAWAGIIPFLEAAVTAGLGGERTKTEGGGREGEDGGRNQARGC